AQKLLFDRNWIDRLPEKVDDQLHVYRFLSPASKTTGGVFQDRTLFAGRFELFTFEADGQRIRFNLLHTGEKRTCAYVIEALAPAGADLRRPTPADRRGPSRYYGWRAETGDLDGQLTQLVHSR